MTVSLCRCGCGRELTRHSYETERQWAKRLASGLYRSKCKRNLPAKVECGKPTLDLVSCNLARPEIVAVGKEKPVRDLARLAYTRSLPCCLCGAVEGVHSHHEAPVGHGTLAGKTDDRNTLPLCWQCHRLRHDKGRGVYGSLDVERVIAEINEAYDRMKGGE